MVVDLTPGDGNLMWACLRSGVAYVGIFFIEDHRELIFNRIKALHKKHMADPSPDYKCIYDSRYAAALERAKPEGEAESADVDDGDGAPNPQAKKPGPKRNKPNQPQAAPKPKKLKKQWW